MKCQLALAPPSEIAGPKPSPGRMVPQDGHGWRGAGHAALRSQGQGVLGHSEAPPPLGLRSVLAHVVDSWPSHVGVSGRTGTSV